MGSAAPVDFKQREGRIASTRSLCVRRSLANTYAAAGLEAGAGTVRSGPSSMRRATAGRRAGVSSAGGRACAQADQQHVRRALQQRCAAQRLAEQDLTRYRLALGQPEPGLFEDGAGARPFGAGHGIRAGEAALTPLQDAISTANDKLSGIIAAPFGRLAVPDVRTRR
ncbi:hypothetical protein BQ8794_180138 [Mesorhizobium prunaredense]|uniref:Uncharacterized protein n=1 Tax=Mesorhizobium prunaredense TaxID=1631249 RepID=A0A1R3V4F7_9HYPH|nr:hypothetical protein BQ8794_180138 [Mesorhizobium prunaredense]